MSAHKTPAELRAPGPIGAPARAKDDVYLGDGPPGLDLGNLFSQEIHVNNIHRFEDPDGDGTAFEYLKPPAKTDPEGDKPSDGLEALEELSPKDFASMTEEEIEMRKQAVLEEMGKEAETFFNDKLAKSVAAASAAAVSQALGQLGLLPSSGNVGAGRGFGGAGRSPGFGRGAGIGRGSCDPRPGLGEATPRPGDSGASRIVNGFVVRSTPRSDEELEQGKVVLSRFQRGNDAAERRKIRERCLGALKTKFELLDYGALIDSKTGAGDLGAAILKQQTAVDKWKEWLDSFECRYLFNVPFVTDFSDPDVVLTSIRKDLASHYQDFSVGQIASWQQFVFDYLSMTDIETADWVLQALNGCITDSLLVQLKQTYKSYPARQRGGLLLFKLLVDVRDADTFENTQLYQNYFPNYRLSDTPGEDVAVSISGFVAVATILRPCDLPSNIIHLLLRGLKHCSNGEFTDIVKAQLGWLNTPAYVDWARQFNGNKILQLTQFGELLKTKFRSLQQSKEWTTTTSPNGSFFKADTSYRQKEEPPLPEGFVYPDPKWQAWFDRQRCTVKDGDGNECGGNHPSKYHSDLGRRNRPFAPKALKNDRKSSPADRQQKKPLRIKRGFKENFKKHVHNLFECLDDESMDRREVDDILESINVADADEDDTGAEAEPSIESGDADDDADAPAMAMAAMGLGQLLNYRAD